MNCHTAQRRLLSLADATRVPASLRAHLIDCTTCQEWQRRVIQVDRHIPLLPVPSSSLAKARVLREVRTKPPLWKTVRDRARQMGSWRTAGAGLAAAVVLFALAWTLSGPNQNSVVESGRRNEPDPLLASLVQRDMTLAGTNQPQRQAETLGQIADDLRGQTQTLAHAAHTRSSQEVLAKWYSEVVVEEVKRAKLVPPAERDRVLTPLARQLAHAAAESDVLARELWCEQANHPLRSIARTARKGKQELDALSGQQAGIAPLLPLNMPAPRLMAAGVAIAAPEPGLSAAEQALRFQRNEKLIQAMVKGSLLLAAEADPVKKADVCKAIARTFADEIERAAVDHEGPRAAELSGYFGTVLQRGVAVNLQTAGEKLPLVSLQNQPLLKVGAEVARIAKPLEEELRREADPEMQTYLERALKSVQGGEQEVREVLKDRRTQAEMNADPVKK